MNKLLLESTWNVVNVTIFSNVSVDDVIAIDNTSWISLHLYVVQGWKRNPLFVCVKKVGVQVDHMFQLMHNVMATYVGT